MKMFKIYISSLNKILIIFALSTIVINSNAQNYRFNAKIIKVTEEGYYKVPLPPNVISELKHSFPDIRIIDSDNNEIQYILKKEKLVSDKIIKTELNIIKNKHKKFKHLTELRVENKGFDISNLIFKIKNTHNPVFVKIYGSDDNDTWFVLKDNFPAVPEYTDADSTDIKIMDIPNNSFDYFKVIFYDYDEDPIDITNVFFYSLSDIRAEYVQLKSPKIIQKDTLNKSIITLTYDKPQFIDMISFGIKGPEYYLRKVNMDKNDTSSSPKTGEEYYDQYKKEFYIGSLKSNRIYLYDFKAEKIEFVIDNKDNQSLQVFKANTYQLKNYLVTYLKPDEEYHLLYGNCKAIFPSYDLPYFKDTIPEILSEARIYNIKKTKGTNGKVKVIWNFPSSYLWYSIGILGIILLIVSLIILKERFGKTGKTE